MLYEALAGPAPFDGTLLQVLQAKQEQDAPPAAASARCPEDLADLAMRPAGPRSGGAARRPEIVRRCRRRARLPDPRPGAAPGTASSAASQQLAATARRLAGRCSGNVAAHGLRPRPLGRGEDVPGGAVPRTAASGKQEVGHRAGPLLRPRVGALQGAGQPDRCPGQPLAVAPGNAGRSPSACPRTSDCSTDVFPVLGRVEVVAGLAGADSADWIHSSCGSGPSPHCASCCCDSVRERRSVVLFVDDLQWGDDDSAEALFEVLRPPEAPSVLFLGTYRSDEAEGSAFLSTWARTASGRMIRRCRSPRRDRRAAR